VQVLSQAEPHPDLSRLFLKEKYMNIYTSENPWLSFEIKDQIDSYLNDCRARRLSPKTLEVYSFYLNWFQVWGESVALTDIRNADQVILRNFLESIQTTEKGSKRSPHTIHGMYRSLRSFFTYLVKEEVLAVTPFAKLTAPRLPKKILLPLTEDEVRTIINHWKKWEAKPASQRTGLDLFQLRNLALFLFMLDSGIRVQECARIVITESISKRAEFLSGVAKAKKIESLLLVRKHSSISSSTCVYSPLSTKNSGWVSTGWSHHKVSE
jgi:site-specific recombinase XerD